MLILLFCIFIKTQTDRQTSVVTVPKYLYSVTIPVKIHGSRYQRKHKNMLIKKRTLFINKVKHKENVQTSMPFFILKYSFYASNKSIKNSKQVSPKFNLYFN